MGAAISAVAAEQEIAVAAVDVGEDAQPHLADCEAVIDFSHHSATAPLVEAAAALGKPVVVGTTGHTEEERQRILAAQQKIPLVWAGNYSIGVNLLFHLTERAARVLPPHYQPEVVEAHHRHKIDAPSGTANDLVENIRKGRDAALPVRYGREGHTGARPDDEIGVHALRGGEIVGEHTVYFIAGGERIELTHRASDRRIFAEGAVHAARWATGQKPGLYNMQDVLGLR